MEVATSLNWCAWIGGSEKLIGRQSGLLQFSQRPIQGHVLAVSSPRDSRLTTNTKLADFAIYSSYNTQAPTLDQALILKEKSFDISPYLSGRCIYLVGMMGSGKTTVGKILSEVLGYSFFDSDKLVEQAVGGTSVAQIFKQYSESFFRDNESKVLGELSLMRRLVVATGGGAVIRSINWKYMRQGITVWLDVPLEALARRIAAVGTGSRPLLDSEAGDAYTKAFKRLSVLSEERGEVYANADARVNLQHIASKLGLGDVSDLTPSDIAIEALVQIESFLKEEDEDETVERNF